MPARLDWRAWAGRSWHRPNSPRSHRWCRRRMRWAARTGKNRSKSNCWRRARGSPTRRAATTRAWRRRAAAALEATTNKNVVTPGPLAPARTLLAEMLLDAGQPADAREAFDEVLAV